MPPERNSRKNLRCMFILGCRKLRVPRCRFHCFAAISYCLVCRFYVCETNRLSSEKRSETAKNRSTRRYSVENNSDRRCLSAADAPDPTGSRSATRETCTRVGGEKVKIDLNATDLFLYSSLLLSSRLSLWPRFDLSRARESRRMLLRGRLLPPLNTLSI